MTKKLLLLALTTVFLSACSLQKTPTPQSPETGSSQSSDTPSTSQVTQKSLKDLLETNSSLKCTWSAVEEGSQINGEILVKGKQFKMASTVTVNGETMSVNSQSDGTWFYTWGDKMPTGIKMKIDEVAQNTSSSPVQGQVDLNKQYDYNCVPAAVTDQDLQAPANIQFTDMGDTLKNLQNMKGIDINKFKDLAPQQ